MGLHVIAQALRGAFGEPQGVDLALELIQTAVAGQVAGEARGRGPSRPRVAALPVALHLDDDVAVAGALVGGRQRTAPVIVLVGTP